MAPNHRAEVLSCVPKCKKIVVCLMEKTHVPDDLCSGVSYGAVGQVPC